MKILIPLATAILALTSQSALAIEPNEVRGELVEIKEGTREIVVRVTEAGAQRPAGSSDTVTYSVPSDAEIQFDLDRRTYMLTGDRTGTLTDLNKGDTVLLRFEQMNDRPYARSIRSETTLNANTRQAIAQSGREVAAAARASSANAVPRPESRTMTTTSGERYASSTARLPDSASALPLLALLGLGFAGVGGMLRRLHR